MIHLLSPAKSLDFEKKPTIDNYTVPAYLDEAEKLTKKLKSLSKKKIKNLMSISDDLTALNAERYQSWGKKEKLSSTSKQAILAFIGDVYQGLEASQLSKSDLEYAQNHLIILSGLYGALKPLDVIEPYRLEMGTRLKVSRSENLYSFWKTKPTELINEMLKGHHHKVVVNLASNEYFKVIEKKKLEGEIVHPEFRDAKNGDYKIISFFAKKARGMMSKFIIENKISNPADLQAFDEGGYRYNDSLSSKQNPVFTREEN